jgi:hypothetical protein
MKAGAYGKESCSSQSRQEVESTRGRDQELHTLKDLLPVTYFL